VVQVGDALGGVLALEVADARGRQRGAERHREARPAHHLPVGALVHVPDRDGDDLARRVEAALSAAGDTQETAATG